MFFEKEYFIKSLFNKVLDNVECQTYFTEKFYCELKDSVYCSGKDSLSCGIYLIINIKNKKFYLGSTKRRFSKRFSEHRSDLKKGDHGSRYLQKSYNKYGKESFIMVPFIVTPKADSIVIGKFEELLLKYLKPKYNTTYDVFHPCMSPEAKAALSKRVSKNYLVTSPSGEQIIVNNLYKFCEERGLDHKKIYEIANGRICQSDAKWSAQKLNQPVLPKKIKKSLYGG